MGLFVDTTGTTVVITELGVTLTHPTTNYDVAGQFSAEDIKNAADLTTNIRDGTLVWKKTSGGATETPTDYDADFIDVELENTGLGATDDQTAIKQNLVDIEEDDASKVTNALILNFEGNVAVTDEGSNKATVLIGAGAPANIKAGKVLAASFSGNPKKATVTFNTAFPDADYAITLGPHVVDLSNASWAASVEDITAAGFTINMTSNRIINLTDVRWMATGFHNP